MTSGVMIIELAYVYLGFVIVQSNSNALVNCVSNIVECRHFICKENIHI